MSIKHGLLALLSEGPRYGYELKAAFEERTGDAWPLNVGQVYTTLQRLERDGLVSREGSDAEGHVHYALTPDGVAEVTAWWGGAVERETPARDELAIKVALSLALPGADPLAVLQAQRSATVRALQAHQRRRRELPDGSTAAGLVLESLVFALEAEVRWLDHCEARLRARKARR